MNDPPLLTPYWSSAFAKQMKPPTLAPYMVALLCMGPCHGQAHTRDPTIGFSPPALLYLLLVIFSAWCKQCLTFPPFFFFCATLNTLQFPSFRPSSYFCSPEKKMNRSIYFDCQGDDVVLRTFFHSGRLVRVYCSGTTCGATRGARADIF